MSYFTLRSLSAAAGLLLISGPGWSQPSTDSLRRADAAQRPIQASATGCTHPFGLREGQSIDYQLLDAKGKPVGSWRYRVLSIRTESTAAKKKQKAVVTTRVQLKSGLYSPSNQVLQQQDLSYLCRHDTVFTDGLDEINYEGLKPFRDRRFAYEGSSLAWPNQPTPNTALPQGGAMVQVSSPSVSVAKVRTLVHQRKVQAGQTSVTVPVGTFNCYVVESQRELATEARVDLTLKSTGRQVDYYDPAVGLIKTEYYDKGGKLVQARVLARR
ncbi:hypothetical protein IC235_10470 [Hymenobacter sp. BT664]|uniref:DUF3108 domain-containing protein n=1 Tax=Hymenobacter montanus TaxID=2771359 RepID=A0A927BE12_9BACT|nr:hypothetical protein [Hymenobacter montanus]MBD2768317.1 hypothetical protein [Hymenobacter montanus]